MKKNVFWLGMLLSLWLSTPTLAQTQTPKGNMSVNDRLVKARAAKAEKKATKARDGVTSVPPAPVGKANPTRTSSPKGEKATPADYKAPVDKSQHGPNGEIIYTGARGAKYYINKNGNKTYLSSNL